MRLEVPPIEDAGRKGEKQSKSNESGLLRVCG